MATQLKNDKGATPDDPWEWYAGVGDVSSWARVLESVRKAVGAQLAMGSGTAAWAEADNWYSNTERYVSLTNIFSFANLPEFGLQAPDELVMELISVSLDGEAYLNILREETGTPSPVGGVTGSTAGDQAKGKDDAGAGTAGAIGLVLGGLVAGWFLTRG